jgi:hypothetical protein
MILVVSIDRSLVLVSHQFRMVLPVLVQSSYDDSSLSSSCPAIPSDPSRMGQISIVSDWQFLFWQVRAQLKLLLCHWSYVSSFPQLLEILCERTWWGWRSGYRLVSIWMGNEFVQCVFYCCVWIPECWESVANLLDVTCNKWTNTPQFLIYPFSCSIWLWVVCCGEVWLDISTALGMPGQKISGLYQR